VRVDHGRQQTTCQAGEGTAVRGPPALANRCPSCHGGQRRCGIQWQLGKESSPSAWPCPRGREPDSSSARMCCICGRQDAGSDPGGRCPGPLINHGHGRPCTHPAVAPPLSRGPVPPSGAQRPPPCCPHAPALRRRHGPHTRRAPTPLAPPGQEPGRWVTHPVVPQRGHVLGSPGSSLQAPVQKPG